MGVVLRAGAGLLTAAALVTATIAMAPPDPGGAPARADTRAKRRDAGGARAGVVRGTVLEYRNLQPSIGRTVVVGGEQTTTDVDGHFAIVAPSGAYDLAVVDPNRTSATFYRGLRRRELLLIHSGDINLVPKGYEKHAAHVDGNLSGGGFDPASSNMASVYFFSTQATRHQTLGGQTHDTRGAGYGPLPLFWIGPQSIAGSIVAVRTTRETVDAGGPATERKGPVVWWEAHRDLKVESGEVATADLDFSRPPMGHIAGQVDADPGLEVTGKSVAYYVLPYSGIPLDGDGRDRRPGRFDFPVPDLRRLAGQYCVNAYDGARGIFSSASKCGVAFGATDATLRLRAPPKLTTIKDRYRDKETISRDTQFGWTAFDGGIYRLAIECGGGSESPNVFVYSTARSAAWPDLGAVGLAFPKVGETCQVSVTGLGPYQGMDEAFSPEGIGAALRKESYSSRSIAPYVTIAPPGQPAVVTPPKQILDDEPPNR